MRDDEGVGRVNPDEKTSMCYLGMVKCMGD